MATLTIDIPQEVAELIGADPKLEADVTALRDVIVWTIQCHAEAIIKWTEGADRDPAELRRLIAELDGLTPTLGAL